MRSLHILFILVVVTWLGFPLRAQEAISIGTRHTLFSHVLNEAREYWVYVPATRPIEIASCALSGKPSQVTTTNMNRICRLLISILFSVCKVSSLPPCIVVAVLNTNRTRDFTPTCSAARRDGTVRPGDKPEGGGAGQFCRFLTEELRLAVEQDLPVNGQHLLAGHSYAGLFTLHVLLNYPGAFDTYIAIDPSLWWDKGYFQKQVERQVDKVDFSGKQLYVAFATQPRLDRKLIHFPLTDDFIGSAVPRMEKRHLRVVSKKFPEETHGTVALPGFYDGLKTLFFRSAVGISLPNEPL